jgi:colanic acid/amylovoran biosynthesis protein
MANKGTQALLKSDIYALREIVMNPEISVSTTDVKEVQRLNLPLTRILPSLADVPYQRADLRARRLGYGRKSMKYKLHVIVCLFGTIGQIFASFISAVQTKVGIRPYYRREVMYAFNNCDIVISSSDEHFKEGSSNLQFNAYWMITWWSILLVRAWEILVAKKIFKKPVVIFPNSVGPFRTWIGRLLARIVFNNTDVLLVRESTSLNIIKSLQVKVRTILTTDIVILFKGSIQNSPEKLPKPVIGVSAGVYSYSLQKNELENYMVAHAKALDYMIDNYGVNVVFLPHYVTGLKNDDYDLSKVILQQMKNKSRASMICVETADEYKSLEDQLDMIVSSKMHPAVIAASSGVPAVCLVYDHKQTGFFQQLGFLNHCLDINNFSYNDLISKMEYVWIHRQEIRGSLSEKIPELQRNVRQAIMKAIVVCNGKKFSTHVRNCNETDN